MTIRHREITRSFVQKHCDYYFISFTRKWAAWVWRGVVLLHMTGDLPTEEANRFMKECWSILMERRRSYPSVVTLVDIRDFEVQTEEFRAYLKGHWDHLLDRNDLQIAFITGTGMKAIIWHAIFVIIGKWERVKFFPSDRRAFEWLSRRLAAGVKADRV